MPGERSDHGSGSVRPRGSSWSGQFWHGEKRVETVLGKVRSPKHPKGLTETQAKRKLRDLMATYKPPAPGEDVTFKEVGERYLAHLTLMGRKPSTLGEYESYLRVHFYPDLGSRALGKISRDDLDRWVVRKLKDGKAPKSVRNWLGVAHGVYEYAIRQDLIRDNPVKAVDKPRIPDNPDLKYLNVEELEAVFRAIPDDEWGKVERTMYLVAAHCGLRKGELIALRRGDVDWLANRIRVRRNFTRGQFGTPKTKRGVRAVPMSTRVMKAIAIHFDSMIYEADDDLVFGHPETGQPLDGSKILKRFKKACTKAEVKTIRFHGLRHSFGTQMASAGVPLRTLQEWGGWKDYASVLIYADYAPSSHEDEYIEKAFKLASVSASDIEEDKEP